jgi:hypothetical protein
VTFLSFGQAIGKLLGQPADMGFFQEIEMPAGDGPDI